MKYSTIKKDIHKIIDLQPRKKTSMEFIYMAGGSYFEDEIDRGRMHLLEHCIASRTKDYDFQGLKDLTFKESLGLNAFTSPEMMGVEISGHYSDFKLMTSLLTEMFLNPTFDKSDLDREKEIVLREISERRGDPNYVLHYDTMKHVFSEDSLPNHETLGNPDAVAQTEIEDFQRLMKKNLERSHLVFSLWGGGVDEEYLNSQIQKHLVSSQNFDLSKNKVEIDYKPKYEFKDFFRIGIKHNLAHEHAEMTIHIPVTVSQKTKPMILVLDELFLKYGGVLYDRLRDELGLVYGFFSHFSTSLQTLTISLACEIKNIPEIIKQTEDIFSDFDKYFKPEKFNEFKKYITKKMDMAEDSPGSSNKFIFNSLKSFGKVETYDDYAKRISEVSVDDVKSIYNEIKNNFVKAKIYAVSKQAEIEKVF